MPTQSYKTLLRDELLRSFSGSFVEVEVKLLGDVATLHEIAASAWIDGLRTAPTVTEPIITHYYDTPDFALRTLGMALRVRWDGSSWSQGIKALISARRGFFRRLECQVPIPTDQPDIEALFGNQEVLANLVGATDRITRLFSTRFERTTIQVAYPASDHPSATHLALYLDQGWIEAGALTQPISEVEIEFVSGPEGRLGDFARALLQHHNLTRGTLSKSDRGYQLINGGLPVRKASIR